VKRIPAWLIYTVLRLVFFIVPFVILWFLGFQPWIAAVVAAVVALSLSIIVLGKFRDETSTALSAAQEKRKAKPASDEEFEDSL
jgi:L-lactate permease